MNKLCRIARGLDLLFKIVFWAGLVIAVVFFVAVVGIPFVSNLVSKSGWDIFAISYNGIQFRFSNEILSSIENGKFVYSIALAMPVVGFVLVLLAIRTIRKILTPMKEGKPFQEGIGGKFRTLGFFAIAYGVISNLASFIWQDILLKALQGLDGQGFTVSVNRNFDDTFVLVAAMLFLCSFIFHYGEELQEQADETL